uniref:Uncharacterized protein n=1 Tax=Arundo donax TaxID=35708 RepID=A0A0A8ZE35_ARUDO
MWTRRGSLSSTSHFLAISAAASTTERVVASLLCPWAVRAPMVVTG